MTITNKSYRHIFSGIGNRLFWSIFILVLVHFAGAMGMAFYDTRVFASMTPYNLLLMFILLLWNERSHDIQLLNTFLIAFYVGIIVELVGVNTQLLFGDYRYGNILGIKFFGVPILIGVNWYIITYSTYLFAGFVLKTMIKFSKKSGAGSLKIFHPLLAALLAVFFDWLMEPVALKLDFWFWQDNVVPLYNYICWFIFSFLISLSFAYLKIERSNPFAIFLIIVQTIFFLFLRIFLN